MGENIITSNKQEASKARKPQAASQPVSASFGWEDNGKIRRRRGSASCCLRACGLARLLRACFASLLARLLACSLATLALAQALASFLQSFLL